MPTSTRLAVRSSSLLCAAAALLAVGASAACGGGIASSAPDAGGPAQDAASPTVDASTDAGADTAPPGDAGPPDADAGPILLDTPDADTQFHIYGITDDGYVVYEEMSAVDFTLSVRVVPVTGGTPTVIAAPQAGDIHPYLFMQGSTVVIWYGGTGAHWSPLASLAVWSHATGLTTIDTFPANAETPVAASVSADGSRIAYLHSGGDLDVAEIGGAVTTLVHGLPSFTASAPTPPTLWFTSNGALFAAYDAPATADGGAGSYVASVFTFGAGAPTRVDLASCPAGTSQALPSAYPDLTGSWIVFSDGATSVKLVQVSTGKTWPLPSAMAELEPIQWEFAPSGDALFELFSGSIQRLDLSNPSAGPQTLVDGLGTGSFVLSPDESHMTWSTGLDPSTFNVASVSTPSEDAKASTNTACETFFTKDSAHAVCSYTGAGDVLGTLGVLSTAPGSPFTPLGLAGSASALDGSRILVGTTPNGEQTTALYVLDLATSAPPRALVQANIADYATTSDGAYVAFVDEATATSDGGTQITVSTGLYAVGTK